MEVGHPLWNRWVQSYDCIRKYSGNNKAATVYENFLKATRQFGLLSRVRSDHGQENVLVAQHMLEHRGDGRGSMITGCSTHKQRIECLWRDLHSV